MNRIQQLRELRRHYVIKYGKSTLRALDRFIGRQSLIGDSPVFDAALFPWVANLEANWQSILAELQEILKAREHVPSFHEISPDQKRISKGDNWKTFVLYGFGQQAKRNCRRCPATVQVLETIPGLQNAWFSILAPCYHIPPHHGVTKGVIRCHLALIVPEQRERCVIRIADQLCQWEEGKCLLFDDTYEHEVWNNTNQERVVLFLDINRPLRLPGRILSRLLIQGIQLTAYVKDARRNLVTWEDRFEKAALQAENFHYTEDDKKPLAKDTTAV
jgi:beta-hydroxylase